MNHIYVTVIVPASVLVPIGAGIIKKKYDSQDDSKTIFWYLTFAGIIDIAERVLGIQHINNLPLLHFYTIVEFLFILRYFQLTLTGISVSKILTWLMFLFPFFSIIDLVFIQGIYQFNSYPRSVAALIIVGLCIYYFFIYGETDTKRRWVAQPANWIITGLLIYFCTSFLYFAFLNIIHQKAGLAMRFVFGGIHATFVMLMYILLSIGFLQTKNER